MAVPLDVEPIVAAELIDALAEEVNHLAESKRDHDEIDAARSQRNPADKQGDQRRGEDGGAELQEAVVDIVIGENADRVRADAEIGGVAEAHHAAETEDQIETDRGDGKDHDAGEQIDIEILAEGDRDRRQQRQRRQRGDRYDKALARGLHRFARGKSPSGRKNSTVAISDVDEHRGGRRSGVVRGEARHEQREQGPQEGAADGVDHADENGGDEGAADRADAADDDDHEGKNEKVVAHAGLDREHRSGQRARERRQCRAQAEHQRVEQRDIDAERRHHGAVGSAGADEHADARSHHQQIEKQRDQKPHRDNGQPIGRIRNAGQHLDLTGKKVRDLRIKRGRAPDHAHDLVEEQDQAEGRQHLIEMVALVQRAKDHDLDDNADRRRAEERGGDRKKVGMGRIERRRRDERADHIERAVGEIDEIHHAEDQRQARPP